MKCKKFERNKINLIISIFIVFLITLSFSHKIDLKTKQHQKLDRYSSFLSTNSINSINAIIDLDNHLQ